VTSAEAAGLRLVPGDLGIAFVVIDVTGEPVNTFGAAASDAFGRLLDQIAADSGIRAVVIKSGKPDSFMAGADIKQFTEIATAADGEALSRAAHALLDRVDRFPKPIVAAIHGACLGLGLELSLACDYRVASDDRKTVLGLPEIQLGILPGAGGTVRLPRQIGARAALDLILAGKSERADKAFRLGLVEELVPVSILDRVAVAAAARLARGERPVSERKRGIAKTLLDHTPVGRLLVYRGAKAAVLKKTGGHYPAPLTALEVIRTGLEHGPEAGYRAEAKAFGDLAVTPVSRELVRIFFATNALKKDDGGTNGRGVARPVNRLGIVGSGFMGSGIAGTAVTTAKVEVRLKDAELGRLGKGIRAALDIVQGQLTRRRITRPEYERLAGLISGAVDWRGFERVDLTIEAVFEDLAVKQAVVGELESVVRPDAIIASNTSTIPIARIAERASRPERIIGMHFFSPVDRMPLLEVIPTDRTDADTIVTAVQFGRRLGKTVIVVADRPGFWVNRILAPYFVEAGRLLTEGVPVDVIDRAMTEFGFPVGPVALLDEVGIDVAAHAAVVMREAFGDRMAPAESIGAMVAAGRIGRKAGRGFYLYHDGHKTDPDPAAYEVMGVKPLADVDREMVQRRLVYALLNEAARARGEAVVRSNRDGDIGAIFGIGFPPFRGGPLRMIENLGPAAVADTLADLATRFGPRFTPADVLLGPAHLTT
jgi:3-hydroxyacyl-CoA dehydrogenase/enoyl-CoA hydratase/3-hydroxybutyryl-CoA epimerase